MAKKDEILIHELGNAIKDARINKGYTRAKFAERIDISDRHLTSVENGERRPSFELLYIIIRSLGISADQIFYPDLADDSDAEQIKRLYHVCSDRDKELIKTMLYAMQNSD